jgi:hypothetical protein
MLTMICASLSSAIGISPCPRWSKLLT